MKRRRLLWAAIAIGLVGIAVPEQANSDEQEVAAPVVAEPQGMVVVESAAPRIRMLAPDGLAYLEQLRQEAAARKILAGEPGESTDEPAAGGGVSRTYTVDEPAVVNRTGEFRFRGVTARKRPIRPVLSIEQRRAAVEAFRRQAARSEDRKNRKRRD